MNTTKWKIINIVPAEHWEACYTDGKAEWEERLTCWALVQEGERSFVTGIVMAGADPATGSFATALPNFKRYRHLRGTE